MSSYISKAPPRGSLVARRATQCGLRRLVLCHIVMWRAGELHIDAVVAELLRLKVAYPEMIRHTPEGLRSIPDWLRLGPNMKVPCAGPSSLIRSGSGRRAHCFSIAS